MIVSALVATGIAGGVLGGRIALADDRTEPRIVRFLADDVQQDQIDLGNPGSPLAIGGCSLTIYTRPRAENGSASPAATAG